MILAISNKKDERVLNIDDFIENASHISFGKLFIIGTKEGKHYKFHEYNDTWAWININNGVLYDARINIKDFRNSIRKAFELYDRIYMFETFEEYIEEYKNI